MDGAIDRGRVARDLIRAIYRIGFRVGTQTAAYVAKVDIRTSGIQKCVLCNMPIASVHPGIGQRADEVVGIVDRSGDVYRKVREMPTDLREALVSTVSIHGSTDDAAKIVNRKPNGRPAVVTAEPVRRTVRID